MKNVRNRSKFHEKNKKWPLFANILPWMASYGPERCFLFIFSARDDLVKVSWTSDARKCQNQRTPPNFDYLSESSQPISTLIWICFENTLFGWFVDVSDDIVVGINVNLDVDVYVYVDDNVDVHFGVCACFVIDVEICSFEFWFCI